MQLCKVHVLCWHQAESVQALLLALIPHLHAKNASAEPARGGGFALEVFGNASQAVCDHSESMKPACQQV